MGLEMKVVKGYEFKKFGTRSEYDWDTLLDGKQRHISGFDCKPESFGLMARAQGRRRGKLVRIGQENNGVVLQAVPASPEQVAKWEAQDSEKAAKRAAKKAEAAAV